MSYATWNNYTQYYPIDVVEYLQNIYHCIQTNTNKIPDINPLYWTIQSSGTLTLNGDILALLPNGGAVNIANATSVASTVVKTQNITSIGSITNITGDANVVTQLPSDSSTKIASTAFVKSVVAEAGGGNMLFSGSSSTGNHCVATDGSGLDYGPSALNESLSTFNFSNKGLVANSLQSTIGLGLNAVLEINMNGTQINTTCPVQVGVPGSANTKVSTSEVIVRDGSTPSINANMSINQVQLVNGADNSKLTYDKLYSNSNNATTNSIVTVANAYASGSLNVDNITSGGLLTLTAPQMAIDTSTINLLQATSLQTNNNLEIVSHSGTLNLSTENGTLNIFTNGVLPQDVLINSNQDVLISSTRDIITTSTADTTMNAVNVDINSTDTTVTSTTIHLNGLTTIAGNTDITGTTDITGATNIIGATHITGATEITGNLLTNSTTASMNTTGVFGITAGDNIAITTTGTSHNITSIATGNINETATGDINLTATGNLNVNATQAEFSATPIHTSSSNTANSFIKIGGTNAQVLLADGSVAPYNSGGSGGNYYEYKFDTSTVVPPSLAGRVNFKNGTFATTTNVYVNHLTDTNIDIDFYLDQIGIGDILYFQDKTSSLQWVKYTVTSRTIFPNDYVDFGVTYDTSEGVFFPNNHILIFTSYVDSETINTRLNALEQKTIYQSTPTLNQTNFAGTVYADTLKIATGASNQYLMADGSTSALTTIGTSGVGTSLVKTGTSPSFVLNSLAVTTGLSSNLAGDTITLTNTLPSSDISIASSGSGTTLLNSTSNPNFLLKSLAVGTGLSIASTTDTITLTNTETASSLSNAGAGTTLVVSGLAPSLSVKSLSSGGGITLTDASNNLQIVNSSPASDITLSNAGTGTSILSSTANPTFSTKSLTAGTNITFTSTADDITINSTGGGGGGTYTFASGGTGTTLVSSTSTTTDFKPVSITAGANVSLTSSGTNIVIASSGASGTNTLNITANDGGTSNVYPVFAGSVSGTVTTLSTDVGLVYLPSANRLTTTAFNGATFTSSTTIPAIGFVGACTSSSKVQTTNGSGFTSTYYPTFVPLSADANQQSVSTDSGLSYIPSQNRLATTNIDAVTFTSSTTIPAIGFVGACTSSSKIQTFDASALTSQYYLTFVAISASNNQQSINTDSALTYLPSTNTLGSVGNSNYTGDIFTSSKVALVAGFVGTASRALEIAQTNIESATAIYYPLMSPSSASSVTLDPSKAMGVDSGLSYAPNTNTLTATTFTGALNGTASKATNIVGTGTNQLVIQTATDTTSTSALTNGASGTFLKSNGATSLPSWVASSTLGFQMSFGGRSVALGDYLQPNAPASTTATQLTGVSYLTTWKCPVACNIVAWSSAVQTTGGATLTINIAGIAGTAISVGANSTNSGTITARPVGATDSIECRINGAISGATLITLYFT